MGKTQKLIDQLVECIQNGQPMSLVVGASMEHARYLQHRLCETLDRIGEPYTLLKGKSTVIVDEAVIDFISIHNIEQSRRGRRGYGEFWHDYSEWCYKRYIDQDHDIL